MVNLILFVLFIETVFQFDIILEKLSVILDLMSFLQGLLALSKVPLIIAIL